MPHLVRPLHSTSKGGDVAGKVSEPSGSGREGGDGDESDEVRLPVVAPRPISPTAAELKEHLPLHLNYRSWCPHCVAGKAHAAHHRTSSNSTRDGITDSHGLFVFLE